MSAMSQAKFVKLNEQQKQTSRQIASLLSQLNALSLTACKQQAYIRTNPDGNITQEYIDTIGANIPAIATAFANVQDKLQDILAVKAGTMLVADMITKHSIVVADVSAELL
jgi:hypothetical protein